MNALSPSTLVPTALVATAALLLASANYFLPNIHLNISQQTFINGIAKYQCFALVLAILLTLITVAVSPKSKQLLSAGNLSNLAEKERWLGISGETTWLRNAAQLLVFISLATVIFMFLAVQSTGNVQNFSLKFLLKFSPWILLFSFTNALSEELIFRFAVNGNLSPIVSKTLVLLVSAVLFGLPHYNGFPNGIVGVVMAGILGYVLSKATYETGGLGIALAIHIVQDIIIFTAILMMNVKP